MLEINNDEKEIIREEINILSKKTAVNEKTKNEFENLISAIESQNIDDTQLYLLSKVLELLLSSGEIRRKYSYVDEQKIFRLYGKTPTGKKQKDNIDKLNKSLMILQSQKIESISFSLNLPGVYGIAIKTDEGEISLNINQSGIYADKLEVEI
ncbi:MAG: hypothetical protein WCA84_15190 [Ignavibacteriaceae bacterium]|jgi:hypothetical protein